MRLAGAAPAETSPWQRALPIAPAPTMPMHFSRREGAAIAVAADGQLPVGSAGTRGGSSAASGSAASGEDGGPFRGADAGGAETGSSSLGGEEGIGTSGSASAGRAAAARARAGDDGGDAGAASSSGSEGSAGRRAMTLPLPTRECRRR